MTKNELEPILKKLKENLHYLTNETNQSVGEFQDITIDHWLKLIQNDLKESNIIRVFQYCYSTEYSKVEQIPYLGISLYALFPQGTKFVPFKTFIPLRPLELLTPEAVIAEFSNKDDNVKKNNSCES